jgi:hypothetical protein
VTEGRDFCEQPGLDELSIRQTVDRPLGVQEKMDWFEAGRERRLDQIFALTTEQSASVTLASGREPAEEPKPRV